MGLRDLRGLKQLETQRDARGADRPNETVIRRSKTDLLNRFVKPICYEVMSRGSDRVLPRGDCATAIQGESYERECQHMLSGSMNSNHLSNEEFTMCSEKLE